jgi:hypothetical protein
MIITLQLFKYGRKDYLMVLGLIWTLIAVVVVIIIIVVLLKLVFAIIAIGPVALDHQHIHNMLQFIQVSEN